MSNRNEFLNYIAKKLGTANSIHDAYQTVIGGYQFHDYSSHPLQRIYFSDSNTYSTAAGRYLLCYKYWRKYQEQLKLHDFSPSSQDAIALKLAEDFNALDDVDAGNYELAIEKCKSVWGDLPDEIKNNSLLNMAST